jgi:MFS family permease
MSQSSSLSNTHKNNNAAYLVVLAGVCAALHIWKIPPALPDLQRELGFTLLQSGFLISVVQFGGMILGLAAGLLGEKTGLRRCMLIGLLLLALASACGALFDSVLALLVFRAIEGAGYLLVVMPAPGLMKRLVDGAYLSRIMGVWGTFFPVATVLALVGGSWLLSISNWRVLWWLMAMLTVAMLWLVWQYVPRDTKAFQNEAPQSRSSPLWWGIVKTTLASRNVWLVSLVFAAYSCQWTAVIGFLPSIYTQAGVSGTSAGLLTAVAAGTNIVGNLSAGRLSHRGVSPLVLLASGFAGMALSALCAFGLNMPAMLQFVAVVAFSALGGLIPATLFLLAIRLAPSPQTTSTTIGWLTQCSALGQFAGPPMVAWAATLAGGWQWTWVVTGACALMGIVLAMQMRLAPKPEAN